MADGGSDDVSTAARISRITFMRNDQICHYMILAAITLWLWDFLITLDTEITYVWKKNGRLIKTLYSLVSPYINSLDRLMLSLRLFKESVPASHHLRP